MVRLLIVDFPYPDSVKDSYKFLGNLVTILRSVCQDVWVCSGNIRVTSFPDPSRLMPVCVRTHYLHEIRPSWLSALRLLAVNLLIQALVCMSIVKLAKSVHAVVFFMMHPYNEIVPMLLARMMGVTVIKVPLGLAPKDRIYAPLFHDVTNNIVSSLVHYYVPEYTATIESLSCNERRRIEGKILPPAHFFLLGDDLCVEVPYHERGNVVGYIGGFRNVKGIVNFIQAAEIVMERDESLRFFIAGDGILKEKVERMVARLPQDHVELAGWIPRERVASYLNRMRLLIIPSYSETGPFVAIESMACGTPILATRVGVVPRIVLHGLNGFILSSNDPGHIAESILEFFRKSSSAHVTMSTKARLSVEAEYSTESAVAQWQRVFHQLRMLEGWE